MKRWNSKSNKPPKYPIAQPTAMPMRYTDAMNAKAKNSAMRVP